jgi:hypothetical protein
VRDRGDVSGRESIVRFVSVACISQRAVWSTTLAWKGPLYTLSPFLSMFVSMIKICAFSVKRKVCGEFLRCLMSPLYSPYDFSFVINFSWEQMWAGVYSHDFCYAWSRFLIWKSRRWLCTWSSWMRKPDYQQRSTFKCGPQQFFQHTFHLSCTTSSHALSLLTLTQE